MESYHNLKIKSNEGCEDEIFLADTYHAEIKQANVSFYKS